MRKLLCYCYRALRRMSIFKRLLFSYFIMIGLLNGVLIYFIYNRVEAEFYDSGINYVYQNLDIAADTVYDKLSVYEDYSEKLAGNRELAKLLVKEAEMGKELEQFLFDEFEGNIAALTLVTEKGLYRAKSMEGKQAGAWLERPDTKRIDELLAVTKESYSSKSWFNTIKENDIYFTKESPKTYLGNYLTLTQKVADREGSLMGVLMVCVPMNELAGTVKTNKIYGQDIFLCDDKNIIINLNASFRYAKIPDEIWSGLSGRARKTFEYQVNDRLMIFTTAQTGKGDLKVLGIMSKQDVMSKANSVMMALIIADTVMILISLLICIPVTTSIIRPLKKLTEEVDRFGRWDFEFSYEDDGKDHIARMGAAFGQMAERTKELTGRLMEKERTIDKEKLLHTEMKVNALRLQINPHFLYNTLDLIRWNVVELENGNGRISRMISRFSGMLRYNVRLGDGFTSVQEEVDYVNRYLELVEILYDRKIEFHINNNGLDLAKLRINKLLFQPIMENAIVHGQLHKREHPWLRVKIQETKDRRLLTFSNNGKPVSKEKIEEINRKLQEDYDNYTGIGLGNVNLRIKLLFGGEYGLKLDLADEITCVQVSLPLECEK